MSYPSQKGSRLHQFLQHEPASRKLASEPFQFHLQRTLTVGDIHEVSLEVSRGDLTGINYRTTVYQRYRFKRTGEYVYSRRDDLKSISAHANAPVKDRNEARLVARTYDSPFCKEFSVEKCLQLGIFVIRSVYLPRAEFSPNLLCLR